MKKITIISFSLYLLLHCLNVIALDVENANIAEDNVRIDICYYGVCHSDSHTQDTQDKSRLWIPGCEVVGVVSAVGEGVTRYQVGDHVGVGCLKGSCQKCSECNNHQEQFCNEPVYTYDITNNKYPTCIDVQEDFVLKIPHNLDLAKAAPLLCAGIASFSPLYYWGVDTNSSVAVVGVGGVGHLAIKIAKALGAARVVAFTHSHEKAENILKIGADEVVVFTNSTDNAETSTENSNPNGVIVTSCSNTIIDQYKDKLFDLVLDTIPVSHNINAYLECLKRDGTLVFVGTPNKDVSFNLKPLMFKRRNISGSIIGDLAETQDMLYFCSDNNITADVKVIKANNINEINHAIQQEVLSSNEYRLVIDVSKQTSDDDTVTDQGQ